jgi:hypothetical protein
MYTVTRTLMSSAVVLQNPQLSIFFGRNEVFFLIFFLNT